MRKTTKSALKMTTLARGQIVMLVAANNLMYPYLTPGIINN